jgi:hypothetical protein
MPKGGGRARSRCKDPISSKAVEPAGRETVPAGFAFGGGLSVNVAENGCDSASGGNQDWENRPDRGNANHENHDGANGKDQSAGVRVGGYFREIDIRVPGLRSHVATSVPNYPPFRNDAPVLSVLERDNQFESFFFRKRVEVSGAGD